jgi:hypothetical protein
LATALQIAGTFTDRAYRQSDYQTYQKVSLSRVDTLRSGATAVPENKLAKLMTFTWFAGTPTMKPARSEKFWLQRPRGIEG